MYTTVIHPAKMYGPETMVLQKQSELELKVVKMNMLYLSEGVLRLHKIRNEHTVQITQVSKYVVKGRESRFRWFDHVHSRDEHEEYIVE